MNMNRSSSVSASQAPLAPPEQDCSNPTTSAALQAHSTPSVAGGPGNNPAEDRRLSEINQVVTLFPLEPPAYSHNLHSSNPQAESSRQAAHSQDTRHEEAPPAYEALVPPYTPRFTGAPWNQPGSKKSESTLRKLRHAFSSEDRAAHQLRKAVTAGNRTWIGEELEHAEPDVQSSKQRHNALHKAALSTKFPPGTLQGTTSKMLEHLGDQRSWVAVNARDRTGKSPIQLAQERRDQARQYEISSGPTSYGRQIQKQLADDLNGAVNAMSRYSSERVRREEPIGPAERDLERLR